MGAGEFIVDVICFPYSIPIGIINYYIADIGLCSTTSKKKLEYSDTTKDNTGVSLDIGHTRGDLEANAHAHALSQEIQTILRRNQQTIHTVVDTHNNAEINCPLSVSDELYSDKYKYRKYIEEIDDYIEFPTYHSACCPNINQITSIETTKITEKTEKDVNDIMNKINIYIEQVLTEEGSEESAKTQMDINTRSGITQVLRQKVHEELNQSISQKVAVSQKIMYSSEPRCDYGNNFFFMGPREIVEKYKLPSPPSGKGTKVEEYNADNDPDKIKIKKLDYWSVQGVQLKQSINIDLIAKNIISSVNTSIMNNQNSIRSTTDIKVTRITNSRIIVISLLINIILLFISFKLFVFIIQSL
tara:strand:- start:13467 stop:14540 length:1074 start_codon:yes stop_codon:yes gene_type:complete